MNLKCRLDDFRVAPGRKVSLPKWPTKVKPFYASKKRYRKLLDESCEELSALQSMLYAHNRHAVLLIFQGMDTAGKDGAIRHVMSGVNSQGCQVCSFEPPSSEELEHDFLWRTNKCLPERGRIGIFNRSYFEEVLIARVLPEVLDKQRLPKEQVNSKTLWHERFQDIVNMEVYLHRNISIFDNSFRSFCLIAARFRSLPNRRLNRLTAAPAVVSPNRRSVPPILPSRLSPCHLFSRRPPGSSRRRQTRWGIGNSWLI